MKSAYPQHASRDGRPAHKRAEKRRLTVNLPLLIGTVVLVAVAAPALFFWYTYQANAMAKTFLARAGQLKQEGDYDGAVAYYQKYLLSKPEDVDVLVNLVSAYSEGERSGARLHRMNQMLYRALGQVPERHDLRMMLAENLLEMNAFREATAEAEQVHLAAPEHELSALKVQAISKWMLSRIDPAISKDEVVSELLAVADQLPGDVKLIQVTADALRQNPTVESRIGTDPAAKADELIDRLVDTKPDDIEARIARHKYRLRHRLPEAAEDLDKALELDAENVEVMLLSAQPGTEGANSSAEARERTLRRVIELAPKDYRGYGSLAGLLMEQGKTSEAITLLASGREVADSKIELGLALADAQLKAERFEAAQATIAQVESEAAPILTRLPAEERENLINELRLLEARHAVSQGESDLAITRLTAVAVSAEAGSDPTRSRQWAQATSMLARLHTQQGRNDQASAYWEALSKAYPDELSVVTDAVNSYLAAGNPQAAIQRIEQFARITEPSPELLVRRVQAHLNIQLARNGSERNWKEFTSALEAAKAAGDQSQELLFAEIQFLMLEGDKPAAVAKLRSAEEPFADNARFWRTAAMAYHQIGEQAEVERALEKHAEVATLVEDARLRTLILLRRQAFDEASELLAGLEASASDAEQQELLVMRAEVLRASGDTAAALELVKQAIGKGDPDETVLATGINLALMSGKLELAQQWEQQLAEKSGDGFEARFARARRLALSWDKLSTQERRELVRLVATLRSERPRWSPLAALSAGLALSSGDSRRALDEFQQAVDLGDRSLSTLQNVVTLLYDAGRFDEVERYMAMVASEDASTPFFDLMKVEVAARQGQNAMAVELAREGVARHPQDADRRLFLGSLLLRTGEIKEGVEVFQQAAKDFPDDDRVWIALFNAYVRSDQVEFARTALGRLTSSSLLSAKRRHFVAGQGYEIIGDLPAALEQYRLSLVAQPSAVDVRLRYANLMARQNPREAQAEFERVLQLDSGNTSAQRQLAVLLATSGNEGDWQRANQLLSATSTSSDGDAATNDRLRAILLSQQGRTRAERVANCRLAREIIEPWLERAEGEENDQNRRVMAGILQRQAELSGDDSLLVEARDQLRAALNQGAASRSELASYIEFLLHAAKTLADRQVAEDAESDPESENRESQITTFLADAEGRLAELRRMQTQGDERAEAMVTALSTRLQLARDDKAGARATVDRFVEKHQDLAGLDDRQLVQRYLVFGQLHTLIEDHAAAEQWYRRLMDQTPEAYVLVVDSLVSQGKRAEAVTLGLELSGGKPSPQMAKVMAHIMTVTDEQVAIDPAVEQAVATALESHQEDIELLQAEAVMRASRGDYSAAIAKMRKILELDPDHTVTLNNLATLLAERPNQRAEALELIQHAIDVAGRTPMLLDTKGTIHLKLGEAGPAIACLEEATAGRATDARYYLHLAAAYELGGRDDEARRMLSEARAFGLEKFVLTQDDREMLSSLEKSLGDKGATQ